jgi:hypothetical protein
MESNFVLISSTPPHVRYGTARHNQPHPPTCSKNDKNSENKTVHVCIIWSNDKQTDGQD